MFIVGNSATGKTSFCSFANNHVWVKIDSEDNEISVNTVGKTNIITEIDSHTKDLRDSYGYIIYSPFPVFVISEEMGPTVEFVGIEHVIDTSQDKYILVCDEDIAKLAVYDTIFEYAIKRPNNVILITMSRSISTCSLLGTNNLFVFKSESATLNIAVPYIENSKLPNNVNLVLVEADDGDFQFYEKFFRKYSIPVITAQGNIGLGRILACLDFSKCYPLIITDACSFSYRYIKSLIHGFKKINCAFCDKDKFTKIENDLSFNVSNIQKSNSIAALNLYNDYIESSILIGDWLHIFSNPTFSCKVSDISKTVSVFNKLTKDYIIKNTELFPEVYEWNCTERFENETNIKDFRNCKSCKNLRLTKPSS